MPCRMCLVPLFTVIDGFREIAMGICRVCYHGQTRPRSLAYVTAIVARPITQIGDLNAPHATGPDANEPHQNEG